MDHEGLGILESLSNAFGVSGFEEDVREIIQGLVEPYVDEMTVDPLGNLIVTKRGAGAHTLMIDAHMDEIGFMVSYVEPDGFLRFSTIGGWDERIIPSHKMTIRTDADADVRGIVGTLPPHILSADDRSRPYRLDELFIDIGATSASEVADLGIRIGTPAVISHPFEQLNETFVTGKALDDRAGCAVLLRTLMNLRKETPDVTVVGTFTVREEVGLLGATTAAYQVNPDIALVLEGTIASDMPGVPGRRRVTRLGAGPAITVADRSQIVKPHLVRALTEMAEAASIPCHFKLPPFGGTDGGAIQKQGRGVLSASVSVPCRYIHSPFAVMRLDDFENTVTLTTAFARGCGDLVHA